MQNIFVNIGNTHAVFAKCEDQKFVRVLTQATRTNVFTLPYASDVFYWVASVVPEVNHHFPKERTRFLTAEDVPDIGNMCSELGADRVANLIAAQALFGGNVFVLDIGTCITLEGLNENGDIAGGAILPGRRLTHQAVSDYASLLYKTPLAETLPNQLAFDTTTALQLGIETGLLGAMKEIIALARPIAKKLVITGGDAPFYLPHIPHDLYAPDLTLMGIKIFAEQQS